MQTNTLVEELILNARKAQEELNYAQKKLHAAEKALQAAQAHLQLCQQKVSEAEALCRRAEALAQKAYNNQNEAERNSVNDKDKLHELKDKAHDSERCLDELTDNSWKIQRASSENLNDNAAIMDKLSGLMDDYETYSLDGGRL